METGKAENRLYKPCRRALLAALSYDAAAVAAAVAVGIVVRQHWWWPLLTAAPCLFALWSLCSTYTVMTQHVIATEEHIGIVSSRATSLIAWADIADVLIRHRPGGIQPGRPDRVIVLSDETQWRVVINASVLTKEQEQEVIEAIRKRARCQIHEKRDP